MERTALKRVRARIEPNPAGYAVDGTGTIADYFDLSFLVANATWGRAVLPDESVVQRGFQRREVAIGDTAVTFELSANLRSTGTALVSGATVTKDSTSKVLEAICGGYQADEGSAVASGASATGVTVTATEGARFPAGALIGVEGTTDNRIGSITRVATQSTDDLTFGVAAHASPAVGRKLYNAQLIYPKFLAPASSTFLQFLVEGEDTSIKRLAMGIQAQSLTIAFPLSGLATWGFAGPGAKWLPDAELATPVGAVALAVGTVDGSNPVPVKQGSVVLTPTAGTTRTTPHIAELTLNPGITWGPAPSHNGKNAIAQMVMMRGEQPSLSMLIEKTDESWSTALIDQTPYQLIAQFGNVPGATLALDCPTMRLTAEPVEEDVNGVPYWRLVWGLFEDEITGDSSTDLMRPPWRLGRF